MTRSHGPARLALFLPTLDDGGAERVMLRLAAAFHGRGHAVDLVLAVSGGPLATCIPPGPRVVDLAAPRSLRALPGLVRYLRRERPRALLSTLEHANVLAVWAARLSRAPVRVVLREANVLLPRDQMRGPGPSLLRVLMRHAYRSAGSIVAVSRDVEAGLIHELGIPPRKVRTIYNPVVTADLEQMADEPLADPWFQPGSPPVVLAAGRLAPQKDFATLLRAFAEVRSRRPARLVILGEGPERAALEALARQLGMEADVRLPGFDHNPFRYMRRASAFALSSIYEGLPGALIQAMACGCRVIATDCPGGSREILEDGALGPLVPPRDPRALATGLLQLLEAPDRNITPPRRGLERFSEAQAVDGYLEVLGVEQRA